MPYACGLSGLLSLVIFVSSPYVLGEEVDTAALVNGVCDTRDATRSLQATVQVRTMLGGEPDEKIIALQNELTTRLLASRDAGETRKLCLALAVAPTDDAIAAVAQRIQPELRPPDLRSLCTGLGYLVSAHLPADPGVTDLALDRLDGVIRHEYVSHDVASHVTMAVARFGKSGFDLLQRLRADEATRKRVSNVYYTALAETLDARALPILRGAIANSETTPGQRIQAIRALGTLCEAVKGSADVTGEELALCSAAVREAASDEAPDQQFAVALKALASINRAEDADLLQHLVTGALQAASPDRCAAALEVMFRRGGDLDQGSLAAVTSLAESAPEDTVRAAAQAVLNSQALHVTDTTP